MKAAVPEQHGFSRLRRGAVILDARDMGSDMSVNGSDLPMGLLE